MKTNDLFSCNERNRLDWSREDGALAIHGVQLHSKRWKRVAEKVVVVGEMETGLQQ